MLMGAAVCAAPVLRAQTTAPFRFALTPAFLDNDAAVISSLRDALMAVMGQDIELMRGGSVIPVARA